MKTLVSYTELLSSRAAVGITPPCLFSPTRFSHFNGIHDVPSHVMPCHAIPNMSGIRTRMY